MGFYTDILPLTEARKLLAAIQKPGRQGQWRTMCNVADGILIEIDFKENITRHDLKKVVMPEYTSYIDISRQKIVSRDSLPQDLFLCGDDWSLSEKG